MGVIELLNNFNQTTKEYFINKSEETSSNLLKSLQVLNVPSELSAFDPGSRESLEFFVNLYEVMIGLDIRSNITWAGLNVLHEASRHPGIRESLIHTFKFVPVLTRLLDMKPVGEKKVKILEVMQELTYGIKISWQEAHLPFLISSLTKWITGEEEEIIPLALGILVNLCYKNLPAVYTLMKSVDIKQFLKILLKLQKNSAAARVQVCKLLIILEEVSGGVPDSEVETYIRSTCPTLTEAVRVSNSCIMRHVNNFFRDIVTTERAKRIITDYKNYAEDIEGLLDIVKNEESLSGDCLAALFEYLCYVIDLEVFGIEGLYPPVLELAFASIRRLAVQRTDALKLISKIIADLFSKTTDYVPPEKKDIMESVYSLLENKLPLILVLLESQEGKNGLGRNEIYAQSTEVIHLLSQLARTPKFCSAITDSIDEQALRKLFEGLLNPNCKENDLFQEPVYTFYVEALCFLTDLADKGTTWLLLFNELVQEKQVLMVLAVALYTGPEHIKKRVLSLTGTTGFSAECISLLACRMAELNKLVIFTPNSFSSQETLNTTSSSLSPLDLMPILTVTQQGHLNNVLEKCEKAALKNENTITSSVMELYHYKISLMNQNQRQLQSSLEAADQRAARLQQTLALTNSEVSRLHQLLHGTQQTLEIASKEASSLSVQLNSVQLEAQETHNKYSQALQNLRSKTVIITELNRDIENLKGNLSSLENDVRLLNEEIKMKKQECNELNTELESSKETITGLKKNVSNLETQLEAGRKELEIKNKNIESLKKEIVELSNSVHKLEKQSTEKDNQISELNKELSEQRRMREIISELAAGKRKL